MTIPPVTDTAALRALLPEVRQAMLPVTVVHLILHVPALLDSLDAARLEIDRLSGLLRETHVVLLAPISSWATVNGLLDKIGEALRETDTKGTL